MTYQTKMTEADIEIAQHAAESLSRMQKFFHENNIGAKLGNELFSTFVKFTFDGNASFGESPEESNRINRDDPQLMQWMSEVQHIIDYIRSENAGMIANMYAETDSVQEKSSLLKSTFLEVLMQNDVTDGNPVDGTVAVFTCLCVNHIDNVKYMPAGGRAFH
ncbi:TPA: hypothetical protein ACGF19_002968 [Vibrio cholerae]